MVAARLLAGPPSLPPHIACGQCSPCVCCSRIVVPRALSGPSFRLLLQILAAQIYEGALVGRNSMHRSSALSCLQWCCWAPLWLPTALGKARWNGGCCCYFARRSLPDRWRTPMPGTAFRNGRPDRVVGQPLLVFRNPSFVWCLCWCSINSPAMLFRYLSIALLAVMVAYLPKTWRIKPADDVGFERAAQHFEAARPGELVTIPVLPAGWTMELRKR